MKNRVIVGVLGFVLVLLALYVFPPIVMEALMAVLGALAAVEVLGATRLVKNHLLLLASGVAALGVGIAHFQILPARLEMLMQCIIFGMLALSFVILLRFHEKMHFTEVACAFFGAILVPYLLLSLVRIFQMENGAFLVLLPLLAAWGADTCALFVGLLFGKHKLAPIVSPKKTVEGAIGGIVGATVLVTLATALLNYFLHTELSLVLAVVMGCVGAVLGIVGDLSFSVIKRQTGIKDYGSLFPGHGGVLDRFDSVLFVAPIAELLFRLMD